MRVLALDTTTAVGGTALVDDERVLAEQRSDPSRSQAEQLPAALLGLLDTVGLQLSDVDLLAVAVGPGSFTGLRIGIATMQGLSFVTRRPIVGISILEALAQAGALELPVGTVVAAWMDARRREVFSALYRVGNDLAFRRQRLIELDPPTVGDPRTALRRWADAFTQPAVCVGDGAVAYADAIGGACVVRPAPPLAAVIGMMAVHRAREGEAVEPGSVQPLYVRRPDAEIAREAHKTAK